MSELVKLANHDGVAVITVENPPVNALSSAVLNLLERCRLAGEKDPAKQALVLIGGGRSSRARTSQCRPLCPDSCSPR
jgi:3-hydroxyacyl-CoA dehydrogenase